MMRLLRGSFMNWLGGTIRLCLAALAAAGLARAACGQQPAAEQERPAKPVQSLVASFCADCHGGDEKAAGLALDEISRAPLNRHTDVWEKVVRKLRARHMPPVDSPRPDERTYDATIASLVAELDKLDSQRPNPGRTGGLRRLNRTEYQNAIRDLLALELNVADLLPPDESSHGFDNITVEDLSPTLLDRYLTAAQKISALAVGSPRLVADTIRVRADLTQEEHVEGLPLGTRGGALIPYYFPQDGEYEIQVRLARDRNEEVEGLRESHELEILLDDERLASFTVRPPKGPDHSAVDAGLKTRIKAAAGRRDLGVTFVKKPSSLLETRRQPYQAHYNMHRHPRQSPALYQVSITGPYNPQSPGDTPSRRRIFVTSPTGAEDEEAAAKQILETLMRRAYRRPVTGDELAGPLALFREARAEGDFDAGIQTAIAAVLVSPHFLLRIERDPPGAAAGTNYRISDLELASRLSFFLWSSIPDDELLDLAIRGELSKRDVLPAQVRRMLADDRSQNLVTNFADQWLHLRNLESITPDLRLFPDFDHNLREALRTETEMHFAEIVREDRSVLDLLKADHTFLNERLAKHYGIPHIVGSRFRRVNLPAGSERGGLLRQGSILTVTSYATRTSPVIRGKWILENILGSPPPPPLPDVPSLKDNTVATNLSVRERLAQHRADAACASCHNLMDPVGFALEDYDAVGRKRTHEEGKPIDNSGGLPDGSKFSGVAGLEEALLNRPEGFVGTLSEKLLTFALGRGLEPSDAPAVRQIVRGAKGSDYRFSAIIQKIVASTPFQMRRVE